jgi:hypothetical protein
LSLPRFQPANTADLLGAHAEAVAQDAVDFGDHLHVGIFDAVVDRLDEVPRPAFAQPGRAGLAFEFGRNPGQYAFHTSVGFTRAADHDGRAVARALLAARNAHAYEGQAGTFKLGKASDGVAEIGVAGVDYDVAGRQHSAQQGNLLVDRLAGLDHDDDRARRLYGGGQFLHRRTRHDHPAQVAGGRRECFCASSSAVENRDAMTLFGYVERQVGAHDAKADKADFGFLHSWSFPVICARNCRR